MVHPSNLVRKLFNGATWKEQTSHQEVFVTFDDGPIPEVTPWVLDEADKWNAKLTFFCVGHNVQKHPDIYKELINRGHKVGNHTYNHLKAYKTSKRDYFNNIDKASELIDSNLFRPPYGQIYPWYIKPLKRDFDKIIMWDILSCDFNQKISGKEVYQNVEKHLQSGSIVVFHDSIKSFKNMKYALPKTLELIEKQNYKTQLIN